MAEETPKRAGSTPEPVHGPSSSRATVPPSEPRASRASFSALDTNVDRPARLQMIIALILLLVLVAVPLYLWRRPRAESIAVTPQEAGAEPASATPTSSEEKVVVGDAHILSCHDPGPKKTPAEQCDHVPEVEKAMAKAIEENAVCVPKDAGGGTIQYVADVSFKRKSLVLTTPREGRSMKNTKVIAACQNAVKAKLGALALDATNHQHQRYRVAVTATYPGAVKDSH